MTAITEANLQANDTAIIEGTLKYSSLTMMRNPSSKPGMGKPVWYVTLANAKVAKSNNPDGFTKYIQLHSFTSHANDAGANGELRVTFQNSSDKFPPRIYDTVVRRLNGDPCNKLLTGELAKDQSIRIEVKVFSTNLNLGMGLQSVLIKDASNIEYINSGSNIRVFGIDPNPDAPSASYDKQADANNAQTESNSQGSVQPAPTNAPKAVPSSQNATIQSNPFGEDTAESNETETTEAPNYDDPFKD